MLNYEIEINSNSDIENESEDETHDLNENHDKNGIISSNIINSKKENLANNNETDQTNQTKKEENEIINLTDNFKENILINKENSSKIKEISKDTIMFNGKEFKNYNRINRYNSKRKIKK